MMFDVDLMCREAAAVLRQLDGKAFPETSHQFELFSEAGRHYHSWDLNAYRVACDVLDCDGSKLLPPCVTAFVVAMLERAIDEDDEDSKWAANDLGALYYGGGRGVPQDFEKAVHYYMMAAERGADIARENLGYCYYYGRVAPPDYEKAYQCFAAGAVLGRQISMYKLGDMYLNGYYVPRDPRMAREIYLRCLDEDVVKVDGAEGQVHLRLGDIYLNGVGVKPDPRAALEHYQAAELPLYELVQDGDYMYKGSLRRAIEGQARARAKLAESLDDREWLLD